MLSLFYLVVVVVLLVKLLLLRLRLVVLAVITLKADLLMDLMHLTAAIPLLAMRTLVMTRFPSYRWTNSSGVATDNSSRSICFHCRDQEGMGREGKVSVVATRPPRQTMVFMF